MWLTSKVVWNLPGSCINRQQWVAFLLVAIMLTRLLNQCVCMSTWMRYYAWGCTTQLGVCIILHYCITHYSLNVFDVSYLDLAWHKFWSPLGTLTLKPPRSSKVGSRPTEKIRRRMVDAISARMPWGWGKMMTIARDTSMAIQSRADRWGSRVPEDGTKKMPQWFHSWNFLLWIGLSNSLSEWAFFFFFLTAVFYVSCGRSLKY